MILHFGYASKTDKACFWCRFPLMYICKNIIRSKIFFLKIRDFNLLSYYYNLSNVFHVVIYSREKEELDAIKEAEMAAMEEAEAAVKEFAELGGLDLGDSDSGSGEKTDSDRKNNEQEV